MRKNYFIAFALLMAVSIQKTYADVNVYAEMYNDSVMRIYSMWGSGEPIENWSPETGTNNMTDAELAAVKKVEISWDMQNVEPTKMEGWFANLKNVTYITGLRYLNTSSVTSMAGMFTGCTSLRYLNLGYFNTSNVRFTRDMFFECTSLETLDIRQFNISNVEDMSYMFAFCSSLKSIFCAKDWSTTLADADGMFEGCTSIQGQRGSAYDANHKDKSYARLDQGASARGYFANPKDVYTYYNASTRSLTYYYDDQMASRSGVYKELYDPMERSDDNRFLNYYADVAYAIIDPSMADYPYNTMAYMFGGDWDEELQTWYGLENMLFIEGLENLNTSRIERMERMFFMCYKLTSLDLHTFNTSSLTNMYEMFGDCNELESVDLSSFNTSHVTNMYSLFAYCHKLRNLDLSNFNTSKVQDMAFMFYYCEMPELDIRSFNMRNVEDVGAMFAMSRIQTIYCNEDWSQYPALADQSPFYLARNLVGGNGTVYSEDHSDVTYARPDDPANGKPGYFTYKSTEGIESVKPSAIISQKILRDGHIYIQRKDKTFTLQGVEIK